MTPPAAESRNGFTLIELICAMSLFTVILLLVTAMLGNTSDHYRRIEAAVAEPREARACLHQLTADFATFFPHPENTFVKSSEPWPQDSIGFLHLQPMASQSEQECSGDLCAVYFYIKDLTIDGKITRCLMRGFRESRETFAAIKAHQVTALFSEREHVDEPIAFGVATFQVRKLADDLECIIRLGIVRREPLARLKTLADWQGQTKAGEFFKNPMAGNEHPLLNFHEVKLPLR